MQLQHCGRDGQDHVLVIHNAAIDLEGMTMQLHTYSISYKKQAYPTMTTRDILSTVYYITYSVISIMYLVHWISRHNLANFLLQVINLEHFTNSTTASDDTEYSKEHILVLFYRNC